jgi:hypothetical protein
MLFKFIAFVAAAIPVVLFLRSVFFRRPTRWSAGLREFKQQLDSAVSIFVVVIGLVVAFALARLAWAWWTGV